MYQPTKEEYNEMSESYGKAAFEKLNLPYSDKFNLFRSKGCDVCDKTGYKGRVGVHELLIASEEIKKMVQKHATVEIMREQSMAEGMTTLLQDGILKAIKGLTDFKQVRRVCIK